MGVEMPAVFALTLVLCAAHASAIPQIIDNYMDVDTKSTSKLMKLMEYKVDEVKEDYQALKEEVSRTNKLVKELKKEVREFKAMMYNDGQQEGASFEQGLVDVMDQRADIMDQRPSLKEAVEEYVRNTDWNTLRKGLEKSLERGSVEYRQLEGIRENSWGHLWQVGHHGDEELATLLMDAGLPANMTDDESETMLHGAAEGGRIQMAQLLLARGADVDTRGWRGLTPFNKAALGDRPEMVKWLADRGADVSSADYSGMTSLHFAAEHGHLDVAKLLVEMKLDTAVRDRKGLTAFDWARRKSHQAVAEFLSSYPH